MRRLFRMLNLQLRLLTYLMKAENVNKCRVKEQVVMLLLLPFYVKSWLFNKVVDNKHINALRARSNNDVLYKMMKEDYQC